MVREGVAPAPPAPSPTPSPSPSGAPSWGRRIAVGVVWLASGFLLALVALGLGARWLDPRTYWWAQLVAVVLPYLTAALIGTLFIAAGLRRWRLMALGAVALVLVGLRAQPQHWLAGPDAADDDLRLVTFNVPERLPADAMADSMRAFVEREAPDVVALQDAWVRGPRRRRPAWRAPQIRGVIDTLAYGLAVPAALPGVGGWKRDATGVPLLVRDDGPAEVIEQEAVIVSDPRDNQASQAIRSVLRWQGRDLVLYDVHVRSFGDAKPWADPSFRLLRPSTWDPSLRRLRSVYRDRAIDVDRIAEAIAADSLPVVVAGDFNSTADNWTYRRLRTAGGVSRTDAFRARGGLAWGRTFHAETPVVRIDHILVDPALAVTGAETRSVGFSDHRPVLARLRWRDAEP